MAYQRQWLLKDHVCYITFSSVVTFDDIRYMTQEHASWLSQTTTTHDVHYIVDAQQVVQYPQNIRAIRKHIVGRMERTGWMLVITDDYYIRHLGSLFAQLLNFNINIYTSLVEAYRFLQVMDEVSAPQSWPDHVNDTMPAR